MITRIEVDGFKSLRGFAVDLEPFTVLIGPNSAGKSNVLDALALLSRLASEPMAEAFKQGRGKSIDQFSRHGAEVVSSIQFAVELLEYGQFPAGPSANGKDAFQSRFRYELTIERRALRSGAERLFARGERLRAIRREDDAWIPAHPELAAYAGYAHGGHDELITLVDHGSVEQRVVKSPNGYPQEGSIPPTHTAMGSRIRDGLVKWNLEACSMLDLGASSLGEPSERIDSGKLSPNASNLPTVLAELPPNVVGEIRADLVSLVPGIASFGVTPAEDEMRLDFELSGGERMPARLVSAGTLRILALLTALRMKPRPYMLCIEEPENGIYPGRLRALLELLREATTRSQDDELRETLEETRRSLPGIDAGVIMNQLPTQILVTTHSPVALAALRARSQHLRFVDMVRRGGERITRVRAVGKPGAGDRGRGLISPREIDTLLQAVESEERG